QIGERPQAEHEIRHFLAEQPLREVNGEIAADFAADSRERLGKVLAQPWQAIAAVLAIQLERQRDAELGHQPQAGLLMTGIEVRTAERLVDLVAPGAEQ